MIHRGGAGVEGNGGYHFQGMGVSTPIMNPLRGLFNSEMSSELPSGVPVVAGTVSVFMGNPCLIDLIVSCAIPVPLDKGTLRCPCITLREKRYFYFYGSVSSIIATVGSWRQGEASCVIVILERIPECKIFIPAGYRQEITILIGSRPAKKKETGTCRLHNIRAEDLCANCPGERIR